MFHYFTISSLLFNCLSPTTRYLKFDPVITTHDIDNTNDYTIFKSFNEPIKLTLTAKIVKNDRPNKFSQPDLYFWIESKCDGYWNEIPKTKEYFDIYSPAVNDLYYFTVFNSSNEFRIAYKADNLLYNAAICFLDKYKYYKGKLDITL